MKTLIFKSNGKPRTNVVTVEFVKEGSFVDAMNYFDDAYPVFYHSKNDEEGFDSSIDENGYYVDSNHDLIVTESDLAKSESHTNNVDNTFFRAYYTKTIDELTREEVDAIISSRWVDDYLKYEVLEANAVEVSEEGSYDIEINNRYFVIND